MLASAATMVDLLAKRAFKAATLASFVFLAGAVSACGAVYPEVQTPLNTSPPGMTMNPPPPEDVLYVQFASAQIPAKTRDGRQWDAMGGSAPDVFAKLIVDKKEIIVTPVESNTLKPTWPDQVRANYRIRSGAQVKVELWDSNALNNHPVCTEKVLDLHAEANAGHLLTIDCESGARVVLQVEPAHGKLGMGFNYELRSGEIYVTRVLNESPAARAGLKVGDQVMVIDGKDVKTLEDDAAQSLINANASVGVKFSIKHQDGKTEEMTLKNGPIYPLVDEDIPLDG